MEELDRVSNDLNFNLLEDGRFIGVYVLGEACSSIGSGNPSAKLVEMIAEYVYQRLNNWNTSIAAESLSIEDPSQFPLSTRILSRRSK